MSDKSDFNIDIKALANNEDAIEVLLNDYARLHSVLAERDSSQKDSEDLMKQVLKSSENAILVTRNLGEIIEYNDRFIKLFGISSDTLKDSPDYNTALVNMYKIKCFEKLTEEEIEQDNFLEMAYEITNLAKDTPQTLKMSNGKRLRYRIRNVSNDILVHSYVDITKEVESYKALKLLEEKASLSKDEIETARSQLYEALEVLDDGFVLYDKDDKLVVYNSAFKKQFGDVGNMLEIGETYENLTYKTACSGIIPNIEGKEAEFVQKLVEQRKSDEGVEKTFQTHDGEWIRQRDKRSASGDLVGLRTNITKLKEHEEELAKATKLFTETTNSMVQGIVVFDDHKLQFYNPILLELLNISDEVIAIGNTFKEYLQALSTAGHYDNDNDIIQKNIEMMLSGKTHHVERQTHYGTYLRIDVIPHGVGKVILTYSDITELKEREKQLEKAKYISQETTNAMVQGIIVFQKGILNFYNPKILDILDLKASHLTDNMTFEDYMGMLRDKGHLGEGEESHSKLNDILDLAAKGEAYNIERKLDAEKYIRVDTVPRDKEYSLVITYTDISDLKNRETELEHARAENETTYARQKKIASALAQGLIMFEKEKVVFFNQQALETLELSEDILFEEQTFEGFLAAQVNGGHFGCEEKGQAFANEHMNIVSVGIPYQLERITKSGRVIRVDGVPNKQENSLILTFTDITISKEREIELNLAKEEAERASEIQSASANAMLQGLLFFSDGKLEFFNPRFLELIGAEESEVSKGMTVDDIIQLQAERGRFTDDKSLEEYQQEIKQNLAEQKSYSLERVMKNGKTLKIDAVISDNDGLVVTYSDITEAKLHEDELKETMKIAESAERAKSEFLANMSHEIRTPMNGVMGMAELLASTELDTKQKMFTDVIVKSGASLLTIINDILDFSKIDAGQMELDPAPFNLREAIEDVATLVSSKVAEKDLELIVRVDPALPKTMVGDVGRIRQIITNLLGNAVKFTEKGHVFVNINGEVHKEGDDNVAGLKFSIEDTGIGIPEEKCAQVFQKFSQVDTSATRKHEGTGLGLSISSSLVGLMGGEIGVESEVGQGSTFWFTADLPVHSEEDIMQVIPGDMTGARVLVIDDNAVNRSILAEQMAAWNFDSASTSTGKQGLEVMRNVIASGMSLDLVVLDYQMPEMSGAEVLETMRNDEALKDIPVVMLTSVDSSQTNQRLLKLGAEANLTKPTRSSMLLETILQVIANKRADVKARSINNLTAKSRQESSEIDLPKEQSNHVIKTADNGLDILVAEDNEVNQIVFRQILEETNLNFQIVDNGRLALAAYKAQKPRLILMDVSMPEMNGKEATIAIRKHERDKEMKRTPIVGVTAHALKGDMESCIDAGMDDYLSKPVSPNKLSLKIEQWLKVDLGSAITS